MAVVALLAAAVEIHQKVKAIIPVAAPVVTPLAIQVEWVEPQEPAIVLLKAALLNPNEAQ